MIPEPEPLTEKDIKKIKAKLAENEESELKIKDLKMGQIIPQAFENAVITMYDNRHQIVLGDTMNGDKFKTFRKSKGGMFTKDSLLYSRGHDHGKYLLIEGNGERKIVRLIEDEELLLFQTLRLIHGIVKDKPYMLLKKLEKGEKLSSSEIYIKKNSEQEDVAEEVINIGPVAIPAEDDHDSITSSVSLFDE